MLRRLEAADAALDEEARRAQLTFVFVGAGYAGVEALAELSDLADDAMRYYPRLRDVPRRWVLVDAAPKILPEIPPRLGEYAARELDGARRRDPRRHDARVGVGGRGGARRRDARSRRSTLVWTAGVRANPLLRELGVPLDDRGRVEVDELLRVRGSRGRLGARRLRARAEHAQHAPDPPTCQHALRQARRLAKNLAAATRSRTATGCSARSRRSAATRASPTCSACGSAASSAGSSRASYHLYQLPLAQRKLRVVVDWTVSLLFRRDLAELGCSAAPKSLGAT